MADKVAAKNKGRMIHEENSGTIPNSSVLTIQKSAPPAPNDRVKPADAYPPSFV